MFDGLKMGMAFIVALLLGIFIFYVLVLRGKTAGNRLKEKAEREGTVTEGQAIKHRYRKTDGASGQYSSMTVIYEYIVNERTYRKKLRYLSPGRVRYPNQITIYYSGSNPKKCVAAPELAQQNEMQKGCLVAIIVPIITFVVLYNVLLRMF